MHNYNITSKLTSPGAPLGIGRPSAVEIAIECPDKHAACLITVPVRGFSVNAPDAQARLMLDVARYTLQAISQLEALQPPQPYVTIDLKGSVEP